MVELSNFLKSTEEWPSSSSFVFVVKKILETLGLSGWDFIKYTNVCVTGSNCGTQILHLFLAEAGLYSCNKQPRPARRRKPKICWAPVRYLPNIL